MTSTRGTSASSTSAGSTGGTVGMAQQQRATARPFSSPGSLAADLARTAGFACMLHACCLISFYASHSKSLQRPRNRKVHLQAPLLAGAAIGRREGPACGSRPLVVKHYATSKSSFCLRTSQRDTSSKYMMPSTPGARRTVWLADWLKARCLVENCAAVAGKAILLSRRALLRPEGAFVAVLTQPWLKEVACACSMLCSLRTQRAQCACMKSPQAGHYGHPCTLNFQIQLPVSEA